VSWGSGDDPPKTSTKPLVPGAKEDPFWGTAKLPGLAGASVGRSSTAVSVTHTEAPVASKTLKSVPIARENALRSKLFRAAA